MWQTRIAEENEFVLNRTKQRYRLAKVTLSVDQVSLIDDVAYQALVDQVFSKVDQSQRNHVLEQRLDETENVRSTTVKSTRFIVL